MDTLEAAAMARDGVRVCVKTDRQERAQPEPWAHGGCSACTCG